MSEAAAATDNSAATGGADTSNTQQSTGGSFLGGGDSGQSSASDFKPSSIFGSHVRDDGQFNEGWTEHVRAKGFERASAKLQLAKDEMGALKMIDDAFATASRRELKGAPNATWQPHEVDEYRRANNIPNEANGYQLKPEKLPDGVQWDEGRAETFAKLAHELNLSQEQAQRLAGYHLELEATGVKALSDMRGQAIDKLTQETQAKFQKEWGADFNDRVEANKAFVKVRFTPEELQDPLIQAAISHPKLVGIIDEARRGLREGSLPGVNNGGAVGSQSPQQQAESIMAANPRWQSDPVTNKQVMDLLAMQAQTNKRK
jgi:hypothetical protein